MDFFIVIAAIGLAALYLSLKFMRISGNGDMAQCKGCGGCTGKCDKTA